MDPVTKAGTNLQETPKIMLLLFAKFICDPVQKYNNRCTIAQKDCVQTQNVRIDVANTSL